MPDSCPEIITDWTYIPLTKANEKSKLTQTCSMTWNIFHLSASLHRSFLDHLREVAIIYFNCVLIFEWMSFLPRDVSWEEKYIKTVSTWKEKGFKRKSVSLLEVYILFSLVKRHTTYQLSSDYDVNSFKTWPLQKAVLLCNIFWIVLSLSVLLFDSLSVIEDIIPQDIHISPCCTVQSSSRRHVSLGV